MATKMTKAIQKRRKETMNRKHNCPHCTCNISPAYTLKLKASLKSLKQEKKEKVKEYEATKVLARKIEKDFFWDMYEMLGSHDCLHDNPIVDSRYVRSVTKDCDEYLAKRRSEVVSLLGEGGITSLQKIREIVKGLKATQDVLNSITLPIKRTMSNIKSHKTKLLIANEKKQYQLRDTIQRINTHIGAVEKKLGN